MAAAVQVETSDPRRLPPAPLVSVLMIVYRHAEYLAEAIDSIVAQQTSFPFELVIGEDASPDESLAIALDYQRRYPHIVRVIHADRNVGMNANSRRVRAAARGSFLAWCEGDDWWCDPHKLARQVALIEADPDIGAVHSDWVRAHRASDGSWRVDRGRPAHARVRRALLAGNLMHAFYHPKILRTCTLLFRRSIAQDVDGSVFGRRDYSFGDTVTSLFITSRWRVAYLPAVTAVYRVSENSALRSGVDSRLDFLTSALAFDDDARAFAGPGYPDSYRVEVAVGLFLWALRARSARHARLAVASLGRLGPWRSLCGLVHGIGLRVPSLFRHTAPK